MIIDKKILDNLTAQAKVNPRLRANLDLRDSTEDDSQRMLNAIEPGTVLPIHRHKSSSVSLGPGPSDRFLSIYNDIMTQNEVNVRHVNIPSGQWHSLKSLESGTILFEAKNGKYAPLAEDEVYR